MLKVLGIETSCDDTSAAIVNEEKVILSNIIASQIEEHQAFIGVVPEIAARAHLQNLPTITLAALSKAGVDLSQIDAVAATAGPGLIGGLIVGFCFGKSLASVLKKPFVAINHLEGHALTTRLVTTCPYPYLLLLASGGHCQFVAVEKLGKYKILGQSLDDAIGEAFDKAAKMLGLGFPGGQAIENKARLGDQFRYNLPKPMINQQNCDMSFSGLKTALRLLIASHKELTEQDVNDIAASFQYTVGEILRIKAFNAIKTYEKLISGKQNNLVIAGGVAANQYLRTILQNMLAELNYTLIAPPKELCTDNAAMIAYAGIERLKAGLLNTSNCPRARWSLEELHDFA